MVWHNSFDNLIGLRFSMSIACQIHVEHAVCIDRDEVIAWNQIHLPFVVAICTLSNS